jgi:hypothetical protein
MTFLFRHMRFRGIATAISVGLFLTSCRPADAGKEPSVHGLALNQPLPGQQYV